MGQKIANMAKELRGEEARAAQGQAAAAALNAEAAARRVAEAEAARRDKVDQEIAADLLLTPTHVTGPTDPDPSADSDSDGDEGQEAGAWRRGPNGDLERIPSDMSPEAIANRAAGSPAGIVDRSTGIPSWADHPHRFSHYLDRRGRGWCLNRPETCWWWEHEG